MKKLFLIEGVGSMLARDSLIVADSARGAVEVFKRAYAVHREPRLVEVGPAPEGAREGILLSGEFASLGTFNALSPTTLPESPRSTR